MLTVDNLFDVYNIYYVILQYFKRFDQHSLTQNNEWV